MKTSNLLLIQLVLIVTSVNVELSNGLASLSNRRSVLGKSAGSILVALSSSSAAAVAADQQAGAQTSAAVQPSVAQTLVSRLQDIPTFCIVSPEGASYMVYQKQRNEAMGYAFLTIEGAYAVLKDAQKTAIEGGYFDTWANATVTTVPLSEMIKLNLKKRPRFSPKEKMIDSIVRIIPGGVESSDGIALDKRFDQQGRVPLFYVDEGRGADDELTVFFSRMQLVRSWAERHPGESLPPVRVLELETLLRSARSKTEMNYLPTTNIRFIPSDESVQSARELAKNGLPPYDPNQMII